MRRTAIAITALAALLAAACDGTTPSPPLASPGPGTPTPAPTVRGEGEPTEGLALLLVVADAVAPTAGDLVLADHLRVGLGAAVTFISDEAAEPSLAGYDTVVIAESCDSTVLGARYRAARPGVVAMEDGAWEALGLTAAPPVSMEAQSEVRLLGAHPVGWDLATSTLPVVTGAVSLRHSGGAHGASAVGIAEATNGTASPFAFAYESGAILADASTAAGRRVAVGLPDPAYPLLNANGWAVLDAAVRWAAGQSNPSLARAATFIADVDADLDQGELALVSRLRTSGFAVTVVDDDAITGSTGAGDDLLVISKTITSTKMSDTLKSSATPIIFWEDNAQAPAFFGTVNDASVTGTAWHGAETRLALDASAPADLRAGLTGVIDLYRAAGSNNITYAPRTDGGEPTLGADAIRIAEYSTPGDGRWSLYVYDAGTTLGDGTLAAGRRGYFGLYDGNDEARYLTPDGLALWDAMVAWLTA